MIKKLVICKDVVTNSLLRHSNNSKPLTPSELFIELEKYQKPIEAILYCPREGTPVSAQLKGSALLNKHIVIEMVLNVKRKTLFYLKSTELYIKSLKTKDSH